MKWVVISGTLRVTNAQVEKDVRAEVRDILACGDGIITGGAPCVDYFALDEALKHDPRAEHIKVIIPTSLKIFSACLFEIAKGGLTTEDQARSNVDLLSRVQRSNKNALIEMSCNICTEETCRARDQAEVDAGDALVAFQVNGSAGTQDTIDRALSKGLTVKHLKYTIEPNVRPKTPQPKFK